MRNDFYIGVAGDMKPATYYGLKMGSGFLDALQAPPELKDFVTSESRVGHGKRVYASIVRKKSREISLTFRLIASSPKDNETKKKAFYALLMNAELDLCVPEDSNDIYHLVYTGKSGTHTYSLDRSCCSITARFIEANPNDRGTYSSNTSQEPSNNTTEGGGDSNPDGTEE